MLDRTLAPESGAINYPGLLDPEYVQFSNGVELFSLNAGDQPVIRFEIIFDKGIWHEHIPGLSWFASKMLMEGSETKTANEIASIFDFHGAHVDINPNFDNTSISLYCLKKHFPVSLTLLHEILSTPVFPEKELDTLINIRRQKIRLNNEKNSFITSKNIRKALYGDDHPYGRSLEEKSLENLNADAVKNHFGNGFLSHPKIFLSGSIGDTEVGVVENLFGKNAPSKAAKNELGFEINQSKDISFDKPDSLQSAIKLGWHIPDKAHQDHFKILITNEIFGGYFGSRLMKNLREEKGLTYGVSSYPIFLKQASFLIVGAEVIADKTQLALGEIKKELQILKTQPVDSEELTTVVNYMSGSFLSKISTPFHLMDKFKSVNNLGLDNSYFQRYFEALESVTSEEIMETANQYFDDSNMSTAIAGKVN